VLGLLLAIRFTAHGSDCYESLRPHFPSSLLAEVGQLLQGAQHSTELRHLPPIDLSAGSMKSHCVGRFRGVSEGRGDAFNVLLDDRGFLLVFFSLPVSV
jgi:hypothetical protein